MTGCGLARTLGAAALLGVGMTLFAPDIAPAFEKRSGCFELTKDCPAAPSIRGTNDPSEATTLPEGGEARIIGANKSDATHFQVEIDGKPLWVSADCGSARKSCSGATLTTETVKASNTVAPSRQTSGSTKNLLALSWHPAFCELNRGRPECERASQATSLVLHGLWPQPRDRAYCGMTAKERSVMEGLRWSDLPKLDLSDTEREELLTLMPGAQSHLQRHEWYKHGTCYGTDAATYFGDAIRFTRAVNQSAVGALFAERTGGRITIGEVRAAFDRSFGKGSGAKVALLCREDGGTTLVTDLYINLTGAIDAATTLGDLLQNAPKQTRSCNGGEIDAAGPSYGSN